MRRRPDLVALAALVAALAGPAAAASKGDAPKGAGIFDMGGIGASKEPITIVSDTLDYDYKNNIVVYRGKVVATQGAVKVSSDVMRITFEDKPAAADGTAKVTTSTTPSVSDIGSTTGRQLKEVVATGNVRIDQGTKWATGGHAVFEQSSRTIVLTENPMLHDGKNEVAGDRVLVYLDEDRSVVEGGRKRVKAVLFPDKQHALTPQAKGGAGASAAPPAPAAAEATAP